MLFSSCFAENCRPCKKTFALNSLKDEIQQRYLKRADVEDMMDQIAWNGSKAAFHFVDTFSEQLKEAGREITQRLEE